MAVNQNNQGYGCCCNRNIILAEISERTTHKTRKKVSGKSVETEKKMSGIVNIKCPSIYAKAHSEPCETSKMELST